MKNKSTKKVSPKKVAQATKIKASVEKGGLFKKFLGKIKK